MTRFGHTPKRETPTPGKESAPLASDQSAIAAGPIPHPRTDPNVRASERAMPESRLVAPPREGA